MSSIYFLLSLMLLLAIGILFIPFWKKRSSSGFLLISSFMIIAASSFYFLSSDQAGLKQWLASGKKHYQLMTEFNELGGVDGMITKVKFKLKNNPDDTQGWAILGRLYQMKGDNVQAAAAFKKAKQKTEPRAVNRRVDSD